MVPRNLTRRSGKSLRLLVLQKAHRLSLLPVLPVLSGVPRLPKVAHGALSASTDYANGAAKIGTVKDGLNVLYVYYKGNAGNQERQAKIAFQFAGEVEQVFDLTQLAQTPGKLTEL